MSTIYCWLSDEVNSTSNIQIFTCQISSPGVQLLSVLMNRRFHCLLSDATCPGPGCSVGHAQAPLADPVWPCGQTAESWGGHDEHSAPTLLAPETWGFSSGLWQIRICILGHLTSKKWSWSKDKKICWTGSGWPMMLGIRRVLDCDGRVSGPLTFFTPSAAQIPVVTSKDCDPSAGASHTSSVTVSPRSSSLKDDLWLVQVFHRGRLWNEGPNSSAWHQSCRLVS